MRSRRGPRLATPPSARPAPDREVAAGIQGRTGSHRPGGAQAAERLGGAAARRECARAPAHKPGEARPASALTRSRDNPAGDDRRCVNDGRRPAATSPGPRTRCPAGPARRVEQPGQRSRRTAPVARAGSAARLQGVPLSIPDRRVITNCGCEVLENRSDRHRHAQARGCKQGPRHLGRAERARRPGTRRAQLTLRAAFEAVEIICEQPEQLSGRRESNSRSQLGNLVGDRPWMFADVCSG